jgi:SET domain
MIQHFVKVISDAQGGRSLLAEKSFRVHDVISPFHWTSVQENPSRMTVQIGEKQHIELLPYALECVNHSCEPNAFFDTERRQLICIKPITHREEITFFYPSAEWDMGAPFDCHCGSVHCIGRVAGAKYLSALQRIQYQFTEFIQQKITNSSL